MNILKWFASNRVAANLLMALILLGGMLSLGSLRMEVFPVFSSETIGISVAYPGAAPEEVEEAICERIEERLRDLEEVKRIRSKAAEGLGFVTVEFLVGTDLRRALDDVKTRVDAIDTFPADVDEPVVQELIPRRQVLSIAISGSTDEKTLRNLGERTRDAIKALPGITRVELSGARPYEISIEVSEKALLRHGLTFDSLSRAVQSSSLNLPGGSVRSGDGEILLRVEAQAEVRREFEELVLVSRVDGTRLTLGDVASVRDGFAETEQVARFDGEPTILLDVFRVGQQDATHIAKQVKAYVEQAQGSLPVGVRMTIWQDETKILKGRLDTLIHNGRDGFLLVLLILALFLRARLAMWVAAGIPISFLGACWLMLPLDLSINTTSLFAFIMVLGIVVDDAIVIGENIYRHAQMGKSGTEAAIAGLQEVAAPVLFAVLTTVAAFAPLIGLPGIPGKALRAIPILVIAILFVSLVESFLILPAHLSHFEARGGDLSGGRISRRWESFLGLIDNALTRFIYHIYRPILTRAIAWRATTLSLAVATLLLTFAFVGGGHHPFSFFPPVESDSVVVHLTLPQGTTAQRTSEELANVESSVRELQRQLSVSGEPNPILHVFTQVGDQPSRGGQLATPGVANEGPTGSHLGEVKVELTPADERQVTAGELSRRLRELVGPIPDAVELIYDTSLFASGKPINIRLSGSDLDEIRRAAENLKAELERYPGVFGVADSFRAGKPELRLALTPEAESFGLSVADLARQVRQGFYGEEVHRIQRGRDELKVMLRYPRDERQSLAALDNMKVRTPDGQEIPFSAACRSTERRGVAVIERVDGRRTVEIAADMDRTVANVNEIMADLRHSLVPRFLANYPDLRVDFGGEQEEQEATMTAMLRSFVLALFAIYALLAVSLRSYVQPLIVITAIPFGIMGAIWGHILLGQNLTSGSTFGMVAMIGVVVNDSLVLVNFIHQAARQGLSRSEAILETCTRRFRAVFLTSSTTFAGLLPLLLERSIQAKFLIPMTTSVAFGILFATPIVLILIPVSYDVLERLRSSLRVGTAVAQEHPSTRSLPR